MTDLPFIQRLGRYHYFRRAGRSSVRLPGKPGSAEYLAAYEFAVAEAPMRARKSRGSSTYVYLLKCGSDRIKIGISGNVNKRLGELRTATSEKIGLLSKIHTGQLSAHIEAGFKVLMRPCNIRGEWFQCSPSIALLALCAVEHGDLAIASIVRTMLNRTTLSVPQQRRLARVARTYRAKEAPL